MFEKVWSDSTSQRFLRYSEATKVSKKTPQTQLTKKKPPPTILLQSQSRGVISVSFISSFHKRVWSQSTRILGAVGLTNLFSRVDREQMERKGCNSGSAGTVCWLFQYGMLDSQRFISLYRWLFAHSPHMTSPKFICWLSQNGSCRLLEQEEHGNTR